MLIDWFTVTAQIVNFLILVYLLKRFLYQPIVRHMNEREEKIANRLQQASDKRAEAQRQIDEFQHKQEEIEQQSAQKLEKAEEEAQKRLKKRSILDNQGPGSPQNRPIPRSKEVRRCLGSDARFRSKDLGYSIWREDSG